MDAIVFHICGLISVIAAGIVVTRKNPVYSTVSLVTFFICIALEFLILRSPFLAVVQVLVYAGAIMVLFLFVIMLLNLTPLELKEDVSRRRKVVAGAISVALFALLATAIARSPTVRGAPDLAAPLAPGPLAVAGETEAIGVALFTTHALAFEYSSILILVAIVGAIYLTKKRRPLRAGLRPTGLEAQAAGTTESGAAPAPSPEARRAPALEVRASP
jgi:NADH-quinone oxidoreductase subunit J